MTFSREEYEELSRIAKRKRVSLAWVVRDALGKYLAAEAPLFHQPTENKADGGDLAAGLRET